MGACLSVLSRPKRRDKMSDWLLSCSANGGREEAAAPPVSAGKRPRPNVSPAGNPLPAVLHRVVRRHELRPGRLVIVGDVHGCLTELFELLDVIRFDWHTDNLCLTGDLCNKGPRSQEVVAAARVLGEGGATWAARGNNDDIALAAWYVKCMLGCKLCTALQHEQSAVRSGV